MISPLSLQAALDQQVKDLTARLGEEVANATKSAKKEAQKLQARVSEECVVAMPPPTSLSTCSYVPFKLTHALPFLSLTCSIFILVSTAAF